jgi:stage V sporulation protein G
MSTNKIQVTDIQVWPTRNGESRVKAMVAVTLNGALKLSGLRLIEGKNGLFLSYPSEKKPGTDQYFAFIHPVDRTLGDAIQEQVLESFRLVASRAA